MNKQDWISDKISKLVSEGYNQDQAIAIAYSMHKKMHQVGGATDGTIEPWMREGMGNQWMEQNQGVTLSQEDLVENNGATNPELYPNFNPMYPSDESTNPFGESTNDLNYTPHKIQFINPYGGVDIPSAAGVLGQSIENNDTLGTIASGLKLATGLGRTVFGAMGVEHRNNQVMKDYYERQRRDLTQTVIAEDGGFFQKGGIVNKDVDRSFYDDRNERIVLGKDYDNVSKEEKERILKHEKFHDFQQNVGRTRTENLQNPSFINSIEKKPQYPTTERVWNDYHNRNGREIQYLIDKVKQDDENLLFVPDDIIYDKIVDGLRYDIPWTYEGEAELGKVSFQKGGQISLNKILTGEYMTGMDDDTPFTMPNAEIESGEYVKNPQGEIQEVLGDTHEKGGELVQLEGNTKILSDHLKIGADLAKSLRKEYDIELKATDTYATVIDKYRRKIGLSKVVEEQEELINKLEKQPKETEHEETLGLNTQYLSNKINELESKKKPLESQREKLFDILFNKQEKSKPKEDGDDKFEDGGIIEELASKHGISLEKAKELVASFQEGGEYTEAKRKSRFNDFYTQVKALGYEGEQDINKMQQFLNQTHPDAVVNYFLKSGQPMTAKGVDIIKERYPDAFSKAGVAPDKQSAQYTAEEKSALQDVLGDDLGNDFWLEQFNDNKFDWRFPQVMPNISVSQGIAGGAQISAPLLPSVGGALPQEESVDPVNEVSSTPNKDALSVLLLPDQYPMTPNSLQPHLKLTRRFDRVNPVLISPEQNIKEINRQKASVIDQVNNVPGAQRAAVLVGVSANSEENINKVITETNRLNSQAISQADARNAQIQAMEENARGQDALSYEQRQLRALAMTQNDTNNYFNKVQEVNTRNYETVNEMNLLNAMYNDFQFTGDTVEKTSPNITFGAMEQYSTPEERLLQAKAKAKAMANKKQFGGRFK